MKRWFLLGALLGCALAVAQSVTQAPSATVINLDGKGYYPPISNDIVYDARMLAVLDLIASRAASTPQTINIKGTPYFAKGNGIADDTTAIQAAFDAVRYTGGKIYFPPGTYCVTFNTRVTGSNTTIESDSPNSAVLKACGVWSNPNPDVASIISLISVDGGSANQLSNITIQNIGFYGTGQAPGLDGGLVKAITAQYTDNVTIKNIRADNFGNEVIWPSSGNRNWNVEGSRITCTPDAGMILWPGAGIQGNFDYSTIRGNIVENCYTAIGASGNFTTVSANVVINPLLEGIGIGDAVSTGLNDTVSGNTIYVTAPASGLLGSATRGIGINGAARSSTISGNIIKLVQVTGGAANVRGIYATATDGTHTISGNAFDMDQNSKTIALLAFNAEAASTSTPLYILAGNSFVMKNEGSVVNYGWSAASTGGTPTIDLVLTGNYGRGIGKAHNGFCIYGSQASGGTVRVHGIGNVCADGEQAFITKTLNNSYYDNTPLFFTNTTSGDAGIQINP